VVNNEGRIESFNQRFIELWGIPESIITSRDDNRALAFVLDQLKKPEEFLSKVRQPYFNPDCPLEMAREECGKIKGLRFSPEA
jgi:PAS domain-containing protein